MRFGDPVVYATVVDYLFGLKPRGTKLGIDRMRPFAAALGSPERTMPWVHVAGTNGKGSVAAMIESILRAAGWRVGLFTSPHLVELGERVQVNRRSLAEAHIIEYTQKLDAVADAVAAKEHDDNRPSFFEFMTAMALLEFNASHCDIGVLEVGLGGEFDATNIVMPEVSVITSLSLEHIEWLGGTLEEIARAKAGIIKQGRPVVIGRLRPEAEQVVRQIADARGSTVVSVREIFGEELSNYPLTNLAGGYQRWNAATATLAVQALNQRWRVTPDIIRQGLTTVEWAGRWQRTRMGDRLVILDASHNEEGARVLETNLVALTAETGRAPIVVVGILGEDRAGPLMATICRHAKAIHFVVPDQPRALSPEKLETFVTRGFVGEVHRSTVGHLFPGGKVCMAGTADDVIVVTGSIYLLGEVMSRLR